jgi:hypothetical protein
MANNKQLSEIEMVLLLGFLFFLLWQLMKSIQY